MKSITVKALLLSAIAPLITLLPQFTSIATAQVRSNCNAEIIGRDRGSRVNLRSGAGINFSSIGYVLVGQSVNMLSPNTRDNRSDNRSNNRVSRQDNQGRTWYQVEYIPSQTRGWIREDFIRSNCLNQ